MYLDAEYRDKGIGRCLLDVLTEWGNEHPYIEKLSLFVFSNNTRARALYEKTGWIVEGICKDDMKTIDGEYFDSVLMAKFVKRNS
jgi:RimJ/RimL family protein N-acetyltransferase